MKFDKTQESLIDLLFLLIGFEVFGKPIKDIEKYDFSPETLEKLLKVSRAHDIAHLVASALRKLGKLGNDEISKDLNRQQVLAVTRNERITLDQKKISDALERAGIDFLPLKGAVIREYYPEPFMRTSGDIDIFIEHDRLDDVKRVFLEELSYKEGGEWINEKSFFSKYNTHIEVHFFIERDESSKAPEKKVLYDAWRHAYTKEGKKHEKALPWEYFYLYHIVHMVKHFSGGGCGIKPYIDLFILNNIIGIDKKKRDALLKKYKLLDFSNHSDYLSDVWFSDSVHNDLTLKMQFYIVNGGVFGSLENKVTFRRTKKGRFGYILSLIFIRYGRFKYKYPIVIKYKILYPFVQVYHWLKLVFCGGFKLLLNAYKKNENVSKETVNETSKFLKDIGL